MKCYTLFIKKFFTFFLTLYIGQHKDNQAQLVAAFKSFGCINAPLLLPLEFLLWRREAVSSR